MHLQNDMHERACVMRIHTSNRGYSRTHVARMYVRAQTRVRVTFIQQSCHFQSRQATLTSLTASTGDVKRRQHLPAARTTPVSHPISPPPSPSDAIEPEMASDRQAGCDFLLFWKHFFYTPCTQIIQNIFNHNYLCTIFTKIKNTHTVTCDK